VGQTRVAVDIGTQFVKIVTVTGPGDAGRVRVRPVGPGGSRAVLTELAATGAEVCLAVPDAWLDGSAAGAREQEALRQLAEDELGLTGVRWAGQLAAVAALAASRGAVADERAAASEQAGGRYLIGDIGAAGVRVALCEVSVTPGPGYAVRQVAVHAAQGGGWQDLNVAVRAALGADADPGLGTWYEQAIAQGKRARLVFDRAKTAPDFRSARVYALAGSGDSYELTAGQAAECFASTADRIKAGVTEVLAGGGQGLTTVLTGGLAWFPLAAATLADLTGRAPLILRPEAAARGALLLADDQAALGECGLPPVSVPMHEVRDGLLGEVSVPLPWTASFTTAGETGEPLCIDNAKLTLDIGASRVTVPLPEVTDGPYRAAARPSWAGGGVLVLRADQRQDTVPWASAAPDPSVHVVPLGQYAER
jgi:hypothetical protein